jgi:hypothetical protein
MVEIRSSGSSIHDPKHWRDRANEARAVAEHLLDPAARVEMLEIAQSYERLAARAQARLDTQK